jgi:hypothetical protein
MAYRYQEELMHQMLSVLRGIQQRVEEARVAGLSVPLAARRLLSACPCSGPSRRP